MTKQSPLALELDGVGAVDNDTRPPEPPEGSAPPHPFRTSPWYDPAVHQQEQERELQKTKPLAQGLRRRIAAFVLVILGGVVLPIASLIANHVVERVVALGAGGTALLIFSVIATLANLLLLPTRKTVGGQVVLVRAPRSALLCVLLAAGALVSALFWAYLSLLFLPLAPIAVVAIVFFGLGLCGLCPHGAVAIGIIQSLRACRVVHRRLGAGMTVWFVTGALLLPMLLAGAAGVSARAQQVRLKRLVGRIAAAQPYSSARMQLIAELRGEEERVSAAYWRNIAQDQRRTLAEIYHRITDEPLTADGYRMNSHTLIRPWWFTEPESSPLGFGPYELLPRFLFGGLP